MAATLTKLQTVSALTRVNSTCTPQPMRLALPTKDTGSKLPAPEPV